MSIKLPEFTKKEVWKKLKERKFEDVELVEMVEGKLKEKRGYVFKMPKEGSPVVLLVSGGLDSGVVWGLLMEVYGLKVYPLFLRGGFLKGWGQRRAVDYFSRFYRERYPDLFVEPEEYKVGRENKRVVERLKEFGKMDPGYVLNKYDQPVQVGFYPYSRAFWGVLYAGELEARGGVRVRTVFSGITRMDGKVLAAQSFTAQRLVSLDVCVVSAEYDWQYSALSIEKELGFWWGRKEVMEIGERLGLDLWRSWSCDEGGLLHCGRCESCRMRRTMFERFKEKDETFYWESIKMRVKGLRESLSKKIGRG